MHRLVLGLLCNVTSIVGMENPDKYQREDFLCCRGDFGQLLNKKLKQEGSNNPLFLARVAQGDHKLFKHYVCAPETDVCDDRIYEVEVERPLFLSLLLHSYHAGMEGKQSARELLQKIARGEVRLDQDEITLTRKDLCNRLLTQTPSHGFIYYNCDTYDLDGISILVNKDLCIDVLLRGSLVHMNVNECLHKTKRVVVCQENHQEHATQLPGDIIDEADLLNQVNELLPRLN
jgi:hypothetical protein